MIAINMTTPDVGPTIAIVIFGVTKSPRSFLIHRGPGMAIDVTIIAYRMQAVKNRIIALNRYSYGKTSPSVPGNVLASTLRRSVNLFAKLSR